MDRGSDWAVGGMGGLTFGLGKDGDGGDGVGRQ